ncbi:MAG: M14 family metallopeptidase [Flavobacteriaceae bacterium]
MILSRAGYLAIKEESISGRYLINDQILEYLKKVSSDFKVDILGVSVEDRNIQSITLGSGSTRILMWSQMHGNESTTTKAVLDFINFMGSNAQAVKDIVAHCTIKIVPMLNPDGAERYTRANANNIDLNRDAQERSQPESQILKEVYDGFRPDYCFNLHDQRTIFNVGSTSKPATLSFLAPAHDEERTISATRALSMQLIVAMNKVLQRLIPGQVGRYDDSFNANCVGDAFQMLNTPTVLFEAGHYHEDYQRERTREYVFYAILTAVDTIAKDGVSTYEQSEYFDVPENNTLFFDIVVKNAEVINISSEAKSDFGLLYAEELGEGEINFIPKIKKTGDLRPYFGHKVFNCLNSSSLKDLKKQSFWKDVSS